jgi:hypothetical protein
VIMLLFGWLILQDYRALSADGSVQANSSATPALKAAPAIAIQPSVPVVKSDPATRSVKVRDGQSLYAICAETFGACRPELLKKIIQINPSISDPDHITAGQKIVLPILLPNSADNK